MNNKKALINYYAKLVRRGSYGIKDVPSNIQELVQRRIKELNDQDVNISSTDD